MSDVIARAKAALEGVTEGPWRVIGYGNIQAAETRPRVGKVTLTADAAFTAAARALVPELVAEIERLHSWDGLMLLLDEHYPESVFPTAEDRPDRDSGPRIVSLIRQLDRLRAATEGPRGETMSVNYVCKYCGSTVEFRLQYDVDAPKRWIHVPSLDYRCLLFAEPFALFGTSVGTTEPRQEDSE